MRRTPSGGSSGPASSTRTSPTRGQSSGRRTIGRAAASGGDWDPGFREQWLDLVARAGTAVSEADAHAITRAREDLESMARGLFAASGETTPRPVHGALIVNLRNILEAMDAVADAQPVRVPARPAVAVSGRRSKSIAWRSQE